MSIEVVELPGEVWKPVKGYERSYSVSSLGRVCFHSRKGSFLVPTFENEKRYQMVTLFKGHEGRRFFVHRLVAINFIPNPLNCDIVNHKNECPYDNRVENLEWCDNMYNLNYKGAKKRGMEAIDRMGRIRNGHYYFKEDDYDGESLEMMYVMRRRKKKNESF